MLAAAVLTATLLLSPATSQAASDTAAVGKCLLSNCQVQLAKCLGDPDCLANLICLQQCNGRVDEKECQIRSGSHHFLRHRKANRKANADFLAVVV